MKKFFYGLVEAIFSIRHYIAIGVMRLIPAQPHPTPYTIFTWQIFFRDLKWRHIILGTIGVGCTMGLLNLFWDHMPLGQYSLLSSITTFVDFVVLKITGHKAQPILSYIIIAILVAGKAPRLFPGNVVGKGVPFWAMREEMVFRFGAERWNPVQKFRSALAFGLIHFDNIIYPLAACFAFLFSGLYLTAIYVHTYKKTGSTYLALKESAIVHAVHNIIAFIIVGCILTYFLAQVVVILLN
ncbi:MAG: hypothetical protein HYV90_00180 [Candidatus Woesebacteria bacterium]|nr:MAG: hypothetical protein HYV90_00180 [Candidatus Woesebacteria bacterium]